MDKNRRQRTVPARHAKGLADRRGFLMALGVTTLGSAALVLPPFSLAADDLSGSLGQDIGSAEALVLASIARLLFPHPELDDAVYAGVVKDMAADMAARPDLKASLLDAIAVLGDRVGGDWLAAPVPAQMDALRELEGGPTFFYLRNRTIESLYRNPVVWQLVGYEGSSIEYGGYIDRGFDDIDWLAP